MARTQSWPPGVRGGPDLCRAQQGKQQGTRRGAFLSSPPVCPNFCSLVLVSLLPPREPLARQNTWPGPIIGSTLAIDLHRVIVGHCESLVELVGVRATRRSKANESPCLVCSPRPIEGGGMDAIERAGKAVPALKWNVLAAVKA